MKRIIYRMVIDGNEYIGTAKELAEISGYCSSTIGNIARGDLEARKGVTIEAIGEEDGPSDWKREWIEATSLFKNVKWVRNGVGRKLKVS